MQFEFIGFENLRAKLEEINDLRETSKLRPLWMDYESIYELHSYKQSFIEFMSPNNHDQSYKLLKVNLKSKIESLEEIRSQKYTHISLASDGQNLLILLSNKPFAIDQIQKIDTRFQISIVKLDTNVHLWGLTVAFPDGRMEHIASDQIKINYQKTQYTVYVCQKSIAAQFIVADKQPVYKRKSYMNYRVPLKNRKLQFFRITPVKSMLNNIIYKSNLKTRKGALKKLGMSVFDFKDTLGSVIPKIILKQGNSGSLFGNQRVSVSVFQPVQNVPLLNVNASLSNLNNYYKKLKHKEIPEIIEIKLNKENKFYRDSIFNSEKIFEIQDKLVIKEIVDKKLWQKQQNLIIQSNLAQFRIDLPKTQQIMPQYRWKQYSHPYSEIFVYSLFEQSLCPPPLVSKDDDNSYLCNYPPFQGKSSSVLTLKNFLMRKETCCLSKESLAQDIPQIYHIATQLKLKQLIKDRIIIFGLLSREQNSTHWEYLFKIISKHQTKKQIENIFFDYYKIKLNKDQQIYQLRKVCATNYQYSFKIFHTLTEILLSGAESLKDAETIMMYVLNGQNIKLPQKIKQESQYYHEQCKKQIKNLYKIRYQRDIEGEKTVLIYEQSSVPQVSEIPIGKINDEAESDKDSYQYGVFTIQYFMSDLKIETKKNHWSFIIRQFEFIRRRWRVIIQRNEESSYICLRQCGRLESEDNHFSFKFSSLVFKFSLTLAKQTTKSSAFLTYANGQNETIGVSLGSFIPISLHDDFKLEIKIKACYVHAFCLEYLVNMSMNLFNNINKIQKNTLCIEDFICYQKNYKKDVKNFLFNYLQDIEGKYNNERELKIEWYNNLNQLDIYYLLNHNSFRPYQQKQVLLLMSEYYHQRSFNQALKNTWLPLQTIRYGFIPLETLLDCKKSILWKSRVFRDIVEKQVQLYFSCGRGKKEDGRYLVKENIYLDKKTKELQQKLVEYRKRIEDRKSERMQSAEQGIVYL